MSKASQGIKVRRSCGEQFRKALVEIGAFDRGRKIISDESHIYLPTSKIDENTFTMLRKVSDFESVEVEFEPRERKLSLQDLLGFEPTFELVGDIAIVDPERAEEVAFALMSANKKVKAVITPLSDVEGEFRTRRFKHVAGDERTTTIYKEHGIHYHVDIEGAYFTSRLGTERLRIAKQVRPFDLVLDMFAGVGPFALLIAKRGAKVIAIDKNPVAVKYLRENALLNKLDVVIMEGDAAELALHYENMADHVIMNLPHSTSQFLLAAIRAAKQGCIVHYYAIAPEEDLYRDSSIIETAAQQLDASVEILYTGIVRSYAPRRQNVVIDFQVSKFSSKSPHASSQNL